MGRKLKKGLEVNHRAFIPIPLLFIFLSHMSLFH